MHTFFRRNELFSAIHFLQDTYLTPTFTKKVTVLLPFWRLRRKLAENRNRPRPHLQGRVRSATLAVHLQTLFLHHLVGCKELQLDAVRLAPESAQEPWMPHHQRAKILAVRRLLGRIWSTGGNGPQISRRIFTLWNTMGRAGDTSNGRGVHG